MSDDLQQRFLREVERETEGRWLASPLAEWMTAHHAQAASLLQHEHMNWAKAAEAFAGSGLRDHAGGLPTAESARETWRRVEERRQAGLKLRGLRRGY